MIRFRILLAALVLAMTAACSSSITGPEAGRDVHADSPYIGSGT
jgi:hypothetical protein